MATRFLKITHFWVSYLRRFYGSRPWLLVAPYAVQQREMFADGFGWGDFYQTALRKLGHEAHEIIMNAAPMQCAWAAEHGVPLPREDWVLELTLSQIRHLAPEVLFLDDMWSFPRPWIERVRATCPTVRLILGWIGTSWTREEVVSAYDAVLSCIPELAESFEARGTRAFHINHAFGGPILDALAARERRALPFTFLGQISSGSEGHDKRRQMLTVLAERTPIEIFSPQGHVPWRRRLRRTLQALRDPAMAEASELPEPILRRLHGPVFGLEMFQRLRDSTATFNYHIGASPRSASNMRLFEATGAGACLVTDAKDNLGTLFRDDEVVSYRSIDECVEKVGWLLDHPAEARRIGERAQRRTLADHNFDERARVLSGVIDELLAKGRGATSNVGPRVDGPDRAGNLGTSP